MSDVNISDLFRLWHSEKTLGQISEELGVNEWQVRHLARRHKLAPRIRKEVDREWLAEMWVSDVSTDEIARQAGVSKKELQRIACKLLLGRRHIDRSLAEWDMPSEQEILERAAKIRESWPPGEAERRWVGPRARRWSPPAFQYDGRHGAFSSSGNALDS